MSLADSVLKLKEALAEIKAETGFYGISDNAGNIPSFQMKQINLGKLPGEMIVEKFNDDDYPFTGYKIIEGVKFFCLIGNQL